MVDVYVINLAKDIERREFQKQQLDRLGLRHTFVNAVSVSDLNAACYQAKSCQWERPLSRAEVCCYLSHMTIWQRIARGDQPALILEDDAYLSDDLPQLLKKISTMDAGYINLEARARKKIMSRSKTLLLDGYYLRRLYYGGTGAAAYVLWPIGAQQLLSIDAQKGCALADAQICRSKIKNAWQLDCAAAIQLDCCEHYQIESPQLTESNLVHTRYQTDVTAYSKVIFRPRRLLAQFKLGLIQLLAVVGLALRNEVLPYHDRFN